MQANIGWGCDVARLNAELKLDAKSTKPPSGEEFPQQGGGVISLEAGQGHLGKLDEEWTGRICH